jgi:phosphoribosylformylglycinamidine synthase
MKEPKVDLQLALEHGLTEEEYGKICEILGRTPNYTELGIFSVMWSEHCSYKNSIAEIKKLPRDGGNLLVGAGEENAGLVDIGDGQAIAFKIESHNHPSAVEPYQGAATGVGGILRDIFTMGARPIAALNSLRFGSLDNPHTRFLFENIVKGIGDYGNCFGVPTVGGEVFFDDSYQGNPLVNAMAIGLVDTKKTASAVAKGKGNPVLIVGSATGRDGIHGATFASEELSEKSESKRPSVQVGDPFTEKLLLEATLEIIENDWIVGIQDMGAAGISCSTSEMSEKGNSGMRIDLSKVPLRENEMTAYEIMLSESQERMLVVAKKGYEDKIIEVFEKWDLNCEIIGEVIDEDLVDAEYNGEVKVKVPAYNLVLGGGAPVYYREKKRPSYLDEKHAFDFTKVPEPDNIEETFLKVFSSPNIVSKKWVFEQYDYKVQTNTIVPPGSDAAVVRVGSTKKGIASSTDCNGRYVYLNPKRGAIIAVAESARNIVCSGAKPLAVTNCLNFGNPYDPEVYWSFSQVIEGMGEACRFFDTPVTGGNVSFYNESPESTVYPTPVIGMVGLIKDVTKTVTSEFKNEGDLIFIIGEDFEEVGGSEYMKIVYNLVEGNAPVINLETERNLQQTISKLIELNLIKSAHDVSEGGIASALAECCVSHKDFPLGAKLDIPIKTREDFSLFSESQSRVIISVSPSKRNEVENILSKQSVPYYFAGTVVRNGFTINNLIDVSITKLSDIFYNTIPQKMNHEI